MLSHPTFDRLARTGLARGLLRARERVVVAVSGGADSVFLLHVLVRATGASLHVAHLHHGLRGESADRDAAFVASLAASLSLPLTTGRVSVPDLKERDGGSVEEVARRARYAFLADVTRATGATAVALGHTADDQAETVLFRLLRGTGIRGLRGMPRVRALSPGSPVRIVRPILQVRRLEIEATLREAGIEWREDESNHDPRFTRNAIRHELMPLLERERGDASSALRRLARDAARAQRIIEALARRVAGGVLVDGGPGLPIDLARLSAARPSVREAALRRLLRTMAGGSFPLRRAAVSRFDALIHDDRAGASAPLGRGYRAVREASAIRLLPPDRIMQTPSNVVIAVPGETHAGLGDVVASVEPACGIPRIESALEAALDAARAGSRLALGPPRPGDRLRPLGAPGSKELRRLLTDWKVPAALRDRVPILRDETGRVVWAVGYRIADERRVTPETTRILRLRFRPAPETPRATP